MQNLDNLLFATSALQPQAIPINMKVVMIGKQSSKNHLLIFILSVPSITYIIRILVDEFRRRGLVPSTVAHGS